MKKSILLSLACLTNPEARGAESTKIRMAFVESLSFENLTEQLICQPKASLKGASNYLEPTSTPDSRWTIRLNKSRFAKKYGAETDPVPDLFLATSADLLVARKPNLAIFLREKSEGGQVIYNKLPFEEAEKSLVTAVDKPCTFTNTIDQYLVDALGYNAVVTAQEANGDVRVDLLLPKVTLRQLAKDKSTSQAVLFSSSSQSRQIASGHQVMAIADVILIEEGKAVLSLILKDAKQPEKIPAGTKVYIN